MAQPASSGSRRTRRDVVRNRAKILDAARRLVARDGLGVGHDAIAHEAAVGVGTVYRHFPDRDELIDLLFDERIGEVVALAEAGCAAADPWEGLVGFVTANLELQSRDKGMRELMLGTGRPEDLVSRVQLRVGQAVGELVDRAHTSGQLRLDVGLGDFPMLQVMVDAIVENGVDADPQLWRRALALVLDGYRATGNPRVALPGSALSPPQVEALLAHQRSTRRRN